MGTINFIGFCFTYLIIGILVCIKWVNILDRKMNYFKDSEGSETLIFYFVGPFIWPLIAINILRFYIKQYISGNVR